MPGQHPDDDLLADLAADVLPLDEARAVEAHVLQCEHCAGLLADAEHVRSLLLADDAGPVPADVWSRIESALVAESTHEEPPAPRAVVPLPPADAGPWDDDGRWDDGSTPLDDPVAWASARPPARSAERLPGIDPHSRDHRNDHSGAVAPVTGTLRRLTTSRRDTRDARDERRSRTGPALLALAAAVALVAVVGAVRLLGHDSGNAATAEADASSSSGSAAAGASAVAGAGLVSSGNDYTKATLASGARALLSGTAAKRVQSPAVSGAPAPAATSPATPASGGGASAGRSVAAAPDPKATDVRNPDKLAACLSALGVPADRLVAVDLATYQGREAAILVDRAAAGGYEVWVVERTCAPGQEGNLDFTTLPG